MTYDEAFDLRDEIVESDDVEPENVWTPEDLEEQNDRDDFDAWIAAQAQRPDEISAFEAYLDRLDREERLRSYQED